MHRRLFDMWFQSWYFKSLLLWFITHALSDIPDMVFFHDPPTSTSVWINSISGELDIDVYMSTAELLGPYWIVHMIVTSSAESRLSKQAMSMCVDVSWCVKIISMRVNFKLITSLRNYIGYVLSKIRKINVYNTLVSVCKQPTRHFSLCIASMSWYSNLWISPRVLPFILHISNEAWIPFN